MKKLFITVGLICFISFLSYAGTVSRYSTYTTGSSVTATNLNGNLDAPINEMNGGLDNDNADTDNGYRFYEVKASNPSAGTEGRMVYNTADDKIYVDDGSSFKAMATQTYADTKVGDLGTTTDNALIRANGTDGLTLQDSGNTCDDSDNITMNGKILLADGSSAAPSLSFDSDASNDTGFYYGGANIFGIAVAGSVSIKIGDGTITTNSDFLADSAGTPNIGSATLYVGDINHKTITDRSGVFAADKNKAYNMFKNLKGEQGIGHCRKLEKKGKKRLNFTDLKAVDPDMIDDAIVIAEEDIIFTENTVIDHQVTYDEFKIGDVIARKGEPTRWVRHKHKNSDGKDHIAEGAEGLELTAYISYLSGALSKCIDKIEELETEVAKLKK